MSRDVRRTSFSPGRGLLPGALLLGAALALPGAAEAQSWSTFQVSRQHQAEEELRVRVEYGAGTFSLMPVSEAGHLYQVQLRYDEDVFEPVHTYSDGTLHIGVDGNDRRWGRGRSGGELELALARGVPTDLRMEFGAVRADMDLGGLSLRELDLATGASEANLRVSSTNPLVMERARLQVGAASLQARELGRLNARRIEVEAGVGDVRLAFDDLRQSQTDLKVSMGVGSLEIRVPHGVGIHVVRSTFLTSVDAPGLTRRDDAWISPEWDEAERRIRIEIDAAFGSVSILRLDRD